MSIFKWQDLSKNELPEESRGYLVYHKNGNIELSVWDKKEKQFKLHGDTGSPITHWTDYKKLGKPYQYTG